MNGPASSTALADPAPDGAEDAIRIPSGVECIAIVARRHGLHVSAEQITLDNHLSGAEMSPEEIANCAAGAGLRAKRVRLTWRGLSHLRKALPVVVTLTSGASMVLDGLEGSDEALSVILQDPKAGEGASSSSTGNALRRPGFERSCSFAAFMTLLMRSSLSAWA